ncbi:MAG: cell division protein FtsL [Veillonella sp.]|uniref:septum formation initiator family protein n=1 Tax=Veillonella sp. TaxID=1926307 RepID=UPI00260056C9|nr:septum formation initiator family protein [Veillonella sp.]MBS4913746.1 cell division protein FtsL [Veillonella sp.]
MLARKTIGARALEPQGKLYIPTQAGQVRRTGALRSAHISRELRSVIMLLALIMGFMFIYEYLEHVKIDAGYRLVAMQQDMKRLSRENDELNLSVAELRSPTRIQQIAQDKLGMVLPDAFVFNSKGTTVEREVKITKPIVD